MHNQHLGAEKVEQIKPAISLREQPVFKEGDLVACVHPHKAFHDLGIIVHQHKTAPYLWLVENHSGSRYYYDVAWLQPAD